MRAPGLIMLVAAALFAAAPAAAQSATVAIQGSAFSPSNLQVDTGTEVTWTNQDGFAHTVTSTSGPTSFDSGNLGGGATFGFTFHAPGTYAYVCEYHGSMMGTVTVTDPSANGDDTTNVGNGDDDANDDAAGDTSNETPGVTGVLVFAAVAVAGLVARRRP